MSLTYHREGTPSQALVANNPVATVNIYHQGNIEGAQAGGHWERTNRGLESINYEAQASSKLVPFLPFLGQDARLNPCGFDSYQKNIFS